jgi:hypothetical protein
MASRLVGTIINHIDKQDRTNPALQAEQEQNSCFFGIPLVGLMMMSRWRHQLHRCSGYLLLLKPWKKVSYHHYGRPIMFDNDLAATGLSRHYCIGGGCSWKICHSFQEIRGHIFQAVLHSQHDRQAH